MLHPAIQLTESNTIHGKGLVATAFISKGEVVWKRDPTIPVTRLDEVKTWSPEAQQDFYWFAFQVGPDEYIYSKNIDHYMNHSCDPNTWWQDDNTLIASHDIHLLEEVTYDYITTEIHMGFQLQCRCGAANCRGVIRNTDYLDLTWQQRYGTHLPSYVLEAIHNTPR